MCGCEDGEPVTVARVRLVRARTAHRCYECPRTIAQGELYERSVYLFEGQWDSNAVCRRCRAIRQAWHDVEGCWAMYGALDDVFECMREMRRAPPSERDNDGDLPRLTADPDCLRFGVALRRHLGRMGPRRAA